MSTPDTLANNTIRTYDIKKCNFMAPQGPHMPVSENYVAIPPALWIRYETSDGKWNTWTLGFDYNEVEWRSKIVEYDVVLNGVKTGDFARVIEKRNNSKGVPVIRIWGSEGWKQWNGRCFV